jgi:hypothetical protein
MFWRGRGEREGLGDAEEGEQAAEEKNQVFGRRQSLDARLHDDHEHERVAEKEEQRVEDQPHASRERPREALADLDAAGVPENPAMTSDEAGEPPGGGGKGHEFEPAGFRALTRFQPKFLSIQFASPGIRFIQRVGVNWR